MSVPSCAFMACSGVNFNLDWKDVLCMNMKLRGKSPIMGRFPNMGRCIISYQEVLHSLLKNVNH